MSEPQMSDGKRLAQLLAGQRPCVSILTFEEAEALRVVHAAASQLGRGVMEWSVTRGIHDMGPGGAGTGGATVSDTDHPAAALFFLSTMARSNVMVVMLDLLPHLKEERTMRALREAIAAFEKTGSQMVLIDAATELPAVLRSFAAPFDLTLPSEDELTEIVRDVVRGPGVVSPINVKLTKKDLETIIRNLRGLNRRQAAQVVRDAVCIDRTLDIKDVNEMLAEKRQLVSGEGLLEYVQSPVSLDEIGGLRRLKFWLEQRKASLCDEAEKFGIEPPRGVLMLGVQGAGKSLSAKAVATAWQRPLLRMDVGALYDKYIGETERRLREAFRQAEQMAPIILWIDEIEKAFASAAAQSADGGLSKRMFGALLTWMQDRKEPVFIVATANDIEALPPELLRKGRFDEIFFIDLPDADARRMIFEIHLKKRKRDPKQFDLERLATASDGYSGAEIEQAVLAALHEAYATHTELTTETIVTAMQNSPPLSVVMRERVNGLRQWAKDRCVPAD